MLRRALLFARRVRRRHRVLPPARGSLRIERRVLRRDAVQRWPLRMPRCRRAMRRSHRLLRCRVLRGRGLYYRLALCALISIAGCTPGRTCGGPDASSDDAPCGPGDRELGAECICDEQCGDDAPRCAVNIVEPSGSSFCTTDCTSSTDCSLGYSCVEGTCQYCSVEPGMVPINEACLCDSDCAPASSGALVQCTEGFCRQSDCLIA